MAKYERLSIEDFGQQLLRSKDLDPIYCALHDSNLTPGQLKRWLLSYWLMYNAGVASYLSELEGKDYWEQLAVAAVNKEPAPTGERWPRGAERRHWRGESAIISSQFLIAEYDRPEDFVDYIGFMRPEDHGLHAESNGIPYQRVLERVMEHPQFGRWIAFKIGDMVERLRLRNISFKQSEVFMFKDPKEAALMLWRDKMELPPGTRPKSKASEKEIIKGVVEYLTEVFGLYKAPPGMERLVNLQEIETILCKWKSHRNGSYPLMKDSREIKEAAQKWIPYSETAETFYRNMPECGSE